MSVQKTDWNEFRRLRPAELCEAGTCPDLETFFFEIFSDWIFPQSKIQQKIFFTEYAFPNLVWCTFARKRPRRFPPTQKRKRAPASGFFPGSAGGFPCDSLRPGFLLEKARIPAPDRGGGAHGRFEPALVQKGPPADAGRLAPGRKTTKDQAWAGSLWVLLAAVSMERIFDYETMGWPVPKGNRRQGQRLQLLHFLRRPALPAGHHRLHRPRHHAGGAGDHRQGRGGKDRGDPEGSSPRNRGGKGGIHQGQRGHPHEHGGPASPSASAPPASGCTPPAAGTTRWPWTSASS